MCNITDDNSYDTILYDWESSNNDLDITYMFNTTIREKNMVVLINMV